MFTFYYLPIGSCMCKLTAFGTNVTACYINWLWAAMFAQRFVHVFFTRHRVESGNAMSRYVRNTRKLILHAGVMSVIISVGTVL